MISAVSKKDKEGPKEGTIKPLVASLISGFISLVSLFSFGKPSDDLGSVLPPELDEPIESEFASSSNQLEESNSSQEQENEADSQSASSPVVGDGLLYGISGLSGEVDEASSTQTGLNSGSSIFNEIDDIAISDIESANDILAADSFNFSSSPAFGSTSNTASALSPATGGSDDLELDSEEGLDSDDQSDSDEIGVSDLIDQIDSDIPDVSDLLERLLGDDSDDALSDDIEDGPSEPSILLRGGEADDMLSGGSGADEIYGEGGNDQLEGGAGEDALFGGNGNDVLVGGSGGDQLEGGVGDDALFGGIGADQLIAGLGDDILTGGDGDDIFVFTQGNGSDVITDFVSGEDSIDLNGISLLAGFDDLAALAEESEEAVILDFGEGDMLTIAGETLVSLDRDDFVFG